MIFAQSLEITGTREDFKELLQYTAPDEIKLLAKINELLTRTACYGCDRLYENLSDLLQCSSGYQPTFVDYGFCQNAADSLTLRLLQHPDYRVELAIRLQSDGTKIRLEVEDNGTGIDATVEPSLFYEKIASKKEVEGGIILNGGAGEHLWLAKRKIDALGGKIDYLNKGQNRGALFWYEIPVASIVVRP